MQSERGSKYLFLVLCAWTILAAGPALTVYGAGTGPEPDGQAAEKQETTKLQEISQSKAIQIRHWNIGDTVTRKIGGTSYRFRCIDQNYADHMDYHRKGALFLCDEVIPANVGSRYEFETPEDASHGYIYYLGPIVCFGDTADYKYSAVRAWLSGSAENFSDAEMVNTGVERAYEGQTGAELWEQFPGDELTAQYLGSQKLEDQLFILSVDEAYRYRNWLWRFGPAKKRNPETQTSEFCKGYWLRTPCGNAEGSQVYIVDLVQGNIRPEAVRTDLRLSDRAEGQKTKDQTGTAGSRNVPKTEDRKTDMDEELRVTGTTGVRPAFVLPQL